MTDVPLPTSKNILQLLEYAFKFGGDSPLDIYILCIKLFLECIFGLPENLYFPLVGF